MIYVKIRYNSRDGEHYLEFETDKEVFGMRIMESSLKNIAYPGGRISKIDVDALIKFLKDYEGD